MLFPHQGIAEELQKKKKVLIVIISQCRIHLTRSHISMHSTIWTYGTQSTLHFKNVNCTKIPYNSVVLTLLLLAVFKALSYSPFCPKRFNST